MLLCACGFALVRTAHSDEQMQAGRRAVASIVSPTPPVGGPPAAAPRAPPRGIPYGAIALASRYALSAFSRSAGVDTDAWISAIAPICTPAWRDHLEAATNGGALAQTTDHPHLVRVFASWAPRGELGATVLLLNGTTGGYEAVYLDLKLFSGRYLVAAAQ